MENHLLEFVLKNPGTMLVTKQDVVAWDYSKGYSDFSPFNFSILDPGTAVMSLGTTEIEIKPIVVTKNTTWQIWYFLCGEKILFVNKEDMIRANFNDIFGLLFEK